MDQIFTEILNDFSQAKLQVIIIGGNAIKQYSPERATDDLDICISKNDQNNCRKIVLAKNFNFDSTHKNFDRFSFKTSTNITRHLDFFIVDDLTFKKMFKNRIKGNKLNYPDVESLLALKIFALREAKGARGVKDLDDIISLMKYRYKNEIANEKF